MFWMVVTETNFKQIRAQSHLTAYTYTHTVPINPSQITIQYHNGLLIQTLSFEVGQLVQATGPNYIKGQFN